VHSAHAGKVTAMENGLMKRSFFAQHHANRCNLIEIPLQTSIHSSPRPSFTQLQQLSLFLSNVRSLIPKIFACITEMWLNENIDNAAIHTENYAVVQRDRTSKQGGGVCAFIN
jgi:hypothetical protein